LKIQIYLWDSQIRITLRFQIDEKIEQFLA
jgi:hypothetical protein